MEARQLEIELARIRTDGREAQRSVQTGVDLLRLWLGADLPVSFRAAGHLDELPEIIPLDQALAHMPDSQPQARAAQDRILAAVARVRGARAERFQDVEVGGFYERELDSRAYGARLEMAVPLWNWNGGAIQQARAGEAAARRQHRLVLSGAEAAVRAQHAAATAAVERVRSLRETIAPLSREVTAALEGMYRVGEVDVLQVLDARRRQMEIEDELLEASLEAHLAALELAMVTGDDLP